MWSVIVRDRAGTIHSKAQLKTGIVTIGRNADCDLVLQSAAVSRLHARLLVGDGDMLIFSDERSANGSFLDGQRIVGAVDVGEGSLITVGDFSLSLERAGKPAAAADFSSTMIISPKDVQLIPQAPPVPPASAAPRAAPAAPAAPAASAPLKSALPGFEFKNLDTLITPARDAVPEPVTLSESIKHLLDQQIKGIQAHRSEQQQTVRSRKDELDQQWQDALTAARELQERLKANPRVLYFVISRDGEEISVKLADNSRRGYTNLIFGRRHPESGRASTDGMVWFGEFGETPKAYREPKEALEDFVRRIASKLA